jgi:hypothetical protein
MCSDSSDNETKIVIKRGIFLGNYVKEKVKVKVKQSRYRPGVAQRVPGS